MGLLLDVRFGVVRSGRERIRREGLRRGELRRRGISLKRGEYEIAHHEDRSACGIMAGAAGAAHATEGWYGRADVGYSIDGEIEFSNAVDKTATIEEDWMQSARRRLCVRTTASVSNSKLRTASTSSSLSMTSSRRRRACLGGDDQRLLRLQSWRHVRALYRRRRRRCARQRQHGRSPVADLHRRR